MNSPPDLTVIVAPVTGGDAIPGCLDAIRAQEDAPEIEVIVPVDGSVANRDGLRRDHPEARLIEVEGTEEDARSGDVGRAHLAIDRRRSAALAAARGRLVALTDEHGRPAPDWAREVVRVHGERPNAVIGGAVENVNPRAVNRALFFMDAGRYQNPVPEGPATYVTDVNVSYKRAKLLEVRETWEEMYVETAVHAALAEKGEVHLLTPKLVMRLDRGPLTLGYALRERFAWARLFAGRRARTVPGWKRAGLAVGSPLLGPLLLFRQTKLAMVRGRHRGAFFHALPLLLLMDLVWTAGEATGYATGRAARR